MNTKEYFFLFLPFSFPSGKIYLQCTSLVNHIGPSNLLVNHSLIVNHNGPCNSPVNQLGPSSFEKISYGSRIQLEPIKGNKRIILPNLNALTKFLYKVLNSLREAEKLNTALQTSQSKPNSG